MAHHKTNPDGWTCYYSGSITAGDATKKGSASFTVQVNAPNSDQASWGPESDSNSDIAWPPADNATLLEKAVGTGSFKLKWTDTNEGEGELNVEYMQGGTPHNWSMPIVVGTVYLPMTAQEGGAEQ